MADYWFESVRILPVWLVEYGFELTMVVCLWDRSDHQPLECNYANHRHSSLSASIYVSLAACVCVWVCVCARVLCTHLKALKSRRTQLHRTQCGGLSDFKAQPVAFSALSPSHLFPQFLLAFWYQLKCLVHTSPQKTKKNHKGRGGGEAARGGGEV